NKVNEENESEENKSEGKEKDEKNLEIQIDIPIKFWTKESEETDVEDDDDDIMILEIKDLNEDSTEKGTCIICYKPIYDNDRDLFKCPNCGREAHYLCATIFLTEYGICPVCSTKLVLDKKTGKYVALNGS
ncbi:MAG: hypothetical protein ACTSXP_01365, partial [Promethearchaeota archaeon]